MAIDAALGRLGIRPGVCTSSTRPANPFEGQVIYETDTNNIRFWSGSAWESNKGGIVSSSAPTGAAAGDIWYDSDDGRAYIYYDDGSSQQWVEFGAPPVQHGKILQVVSATKTDTFTTSSTSYVDVTGLSVSITPSTTSSKILVMVSMNTSSEDATTTNTMIQLVRDSTAISIGDSAGSRIQSSFFGNSAPAGELNQTRSVSLTHLDSPNTTSATTYKVQALVTQAFPMYVNRAFTDADSSISGRSASNITVMEVAG